MAPPAPLALWLVVLESPLKVLSAPETQQVAGSEARQAVVFVLQALPPPVV